MWIDPNVFASKNYQPCTVFVIPGWGRQWFYDGGARWSTQTLVFTSSIKIGHHILKLKYLIHFVLFIPYSGKTRHIFCIGQENKRFSFLQLAIKVVINSLKEKVLILIYSRLLSLWYYMRPAANIQTFLRNIPKKKKEDETELILFHCMNKIWNALIYVSVTLLWKSRRSILTNSPFWPTIVCRLRMNPFHTILHAFSIRSLQNSNQLIYWVTVYSFWNYYIEMLYKNLVIK